MKTPEEIEAERIAAQEKADREAKEKTDREAKEKADREKAEEDARTKAKADREAQEKLTRDSKAETERCASIVDACSKHGIDPMPFIRSGESTQSAYEKILDQISPDKGTTGVVRDGRDSFREAALEGLMVRSGALARKDCKSGGETMVGFSLMELARECLSRAGLSTAGDKLSIAARALVGPKMDGGVIGNFMTRKEDITAGTSDFPLLLASALNKSLDAAYAEVPTHYKKWAAVGNVSDFKEVTRVEISEIGELSKIEELGQYTSAKFKDRKETNRVYTYGKIFGLSRQAIINDDLDGFMRIPLAFARSAARMPQILALKKLLENPALVQDSAAVFSDAHGNANTGAAYALDTLAHAEAGLKIMRGLMLKQRSPVHPDDASEAAYLNLMPRVLLCNPDDEFIAAQAVGSTGSIITANGNIINPINSWGLQVIPDQNIANLGWSGTATQWFLFANPVEAPVIEVVFLNGQQSPFMEEADQTNVDGRSWKVRLDVGANAIGFRGAVRAAGA
jgi:hypothetical protein